MGTAICASAECRISGGSPAPSLPINMAHAARKCLADESGIVFASRGAAFRCSGRKICHSCHAKLRQQHRWAMPRSSGSRSADPAEARNAFGRPGIGRAARGHKAGRAKSFGRAHHRSDISWILHAGQHRPPRKISPRKISSNARLARPDQRGNALRMFGSGNAVKEPLRGPQDSRARIRRGRRESQDVSLPS